MSRFGKIFEKKNLKSYTGIDISKECITQAKRWLGKIRNSKNFKLIVEDRRRSRYGDGLQNWGKYDAINSFFCFHFASTSDEIAKRAIQNVYDNLVLAGKFIAIVPDRVKIIEAAKSGVKSKLFRIENYDGRNHYDFSFADGSIDKMPEYLFNGHLFMKECSKIGLQY